MEEDLNSAQQSRREFLEKAGKLAAYTPPAITLLMYPGTEAIASGVEGRGGGRRGGGFECRRMGGSTTCRGGGVGRGGGGRP